MIRMDPYGPDSIYFPPQSYLTSEQFPDDWMEIFDVLDERLSARVEQQV